MKLIMRTLTSKQVETMGYRDAIEYQIVGGPVMSFWDGELEDANLARDFRAVFNIQEFVELAWKAGKDGEVLEITREPLDLRD